MEHTAVADIMATLGRRLESAPNADAALPVVVETAAELIDGIDHATISIIYRRGQVETVAASSDRALRFDQIQYDARHGPCLDVLDPTTPPVLVAPDLAREDRWHIYCPRALESGVRSQVAARLSSSGRSRGSLNLYGTGSREVTPHTVRLAELFAVHAALALDRAHTEANLRIALNTRHTIGQAIGIVRERYGLTEDQAVTYLTRISQHTNTKLRQVADQIAQSVDDGSAPHSPVLDHAPPRAQVAWPDQVP